MKFLSRRWGQDSPAKAPTTILSIRQSPQDLSDERAIDVIDRMSAVSTAHDNHHDDLQDFCRRTLYSFESWNHLSQCCPSDSSISVHEVQMLILMAMPPRCLDSNILQNSSWCLPGVRHLREVCTRIYSYDWSSTICCC